jgi:hypothetical protein
MFSARDMILFTKKDLSCSDTLPSPITHDHVLGRELEDDNGYHLYPVLHLAPSTWTSFN